MGGGQEETTSTTTPWSGAIPYLLGNEKKGIPGIMPEAAAQFQSDKPQYFPGSTVAPLAPESEIAFQMGANRATAGSPLNAAAGAETMRTIEGEYLDSNPYLDAIKGRGLREASRIAGAFGAGGRTGSGAMQDSIAEGYTAAVAPYEFQAYEAERGRMGDMARFAPSLAAEDYRDLAALQNIGTARQAQGQAELTDEVNRWNFDQTIEAQKLQDYANLIRGITAPFGTTTGTTPTAGPAQGALGGAMSGAAMGTTLFPGWGTAIGALGGGLLGGLGGM